MRRRWNRSIVLYCWMRWMRPQTVQLNRQEDHAMEVEDKGEDRTIQNGDDPSQPATHMPAPAPSFAAGYAKLSAGCNAWSASRNHTACASHVFRSLSACSGVNCGSEAVGIWSPVEGDLASVTKPRCSIRSAIKSRRWGGGFRVRFRRTGCPSSLSSNVPSPPSARCLASPSVQARDCVHPSFDRRSFHPRQRA